MEFLTLIKMIRWNRNLIQKLLNCQSLRLLTVCISCEGVIIYETNNNQPLFLLNRKTNVRQKMTAHDYWRVDRVVALNNLSRSISFQGFGENNVLRSLSFRLNAMVISGHPACFGIITPHSLVNQRELGDRYFDTWNVRSLVHNSLWNFWDHFASFACVNWNFSPVLYGGSLQFHSSTVTFKGRIMMRIRKKIRMLMTWEFIYWKLIIVR